MILATNNHYSAPLNKFLHNISISRKLGLVIALFVVQVATLLYFLIESSIKDMARTDHEMTGLNRIQMVRTTAFGLWKYRAIGHANDLIPSSQTEVIHWEVESFQLISKLDSSEFETIRTEIDLLKGYHYDLSANRFDAPSRSRMFQAMTQQALMPAVHRLSNQFRLTTDPDVDAHYLINLLLFSFSEFLEATARVHELGLQTLRSSASGGELRHWIDRTRELQATMDRQLQQAYAETPSLKNVFDKDFENLLVLTGDQLELAEGSILKKDTLFKVIDFVNSHRFVLEKSGKLSSKIQYTVVELLDYRSAALRRDLWMTAGIVTVLIISATALAWFLFRSVSVTIRNVAQRMTSADVNTLFNDDREDEIGRLTRGFDALVAMVRETIIEVQQAADRVATASQSIASSTDSILISARAQEDHTSSVTAGAEEMSHTTREITLNTERTRDIAAEAHNTTQNGAAVIEEATATMERLIRLVHDMSVRVESLQQSSQRADRILSIIDNLAKQINLIALNAAVQASKAGTHGRGFSMVAAEILNLADRTFESVKEIQAIIHTVKKEVSQVSQMMNQSTIETEMGLRLAAHSKEQLIEITRAFDHVSVMIAKSAATTHQQASATDHMVARMKQVHANEKHLVDHVALIARSAESMNRLTKFLHQALTKFKLNADIRPQPDPLANQIEPLIDENDEESENWENSHSHVDSKVSAIL